jgi:uncharacterized protein
MPKPDFSLPGSPCWIDLMTTDPERATAFYGSLFGWTSQGAGEEFGGYVTFSKDGQQVAGAMQSQPDTGPPNVWSVYLATDDAKATTEAATSHGGRVHVPPMDVAQIGTMAFLEDAGGAAIGAWQPGTHIGFDVIGEPATPNWFELLTRDYAAAVRWYEDVFRWETQQAGNSDDFRYTTLGGGDAQRAGIMDATSFLPDGVPAHWSVYFGVDDADAALAAIERLGGSTISPAETTPYGRMAQVSDPLGATFKLLDPSKRS